jgi:putative Mg2+ transporter-C (MgtC) family protein
MPLTLTWQDIFVRISLTVVAGFLIGLNRGEHGRAAGLRTTMLVCLAASLSMIEVNLLLPMAGKTSTSFISLDLMRLPLGILSGMGFIGAGAIVRRDSLVMGVTTAATLWFVTVVGLCLGGGQIGLGLVGLALGLIILWALKRLEMRVHHDHSAQLLIVTDPQGPTEKDIGDTLKSARYEVVSSKVAFANRTKQSKFQFELRWHEPGTVRETPPEVMELARHPGIRRLEWTPTRS